jgi:glyoxylase I family protein
MANVTGFGGLFFRANDPDALADWYEKHFSINSMSNGIWIQKEGPTVFAPFKKSTQYFGRDDQQFMINLRVTDLEELLNELKAAGVRIDEKRQDEPYGRFAWVYDPEGNKIELWQPIEEPSAE